MRAAIVFGTAALALGGCQSADEKRAAETGEIDVAEASSDQVSKLIKAAAPKTAPKPGLWKADLKIEAVDTGSGDSAEQLALAKGLERSTTECKTAEELKPFDIEKLEKAAGTCTFTRFVSKAGKVDAMIQCKKEGAPFSTIRIAGTTSSSAFDVVTENRTGVAGQPGYSLVRMRATGQHVGECPR